MPMPMQEQLARPLPEAADAATKPMKQPGEQDIADLFTCYMYDSSKTAADDYALSLLSQQWLDDYEQMIRQFCERENIHYYVREDGTERRMNR